MKVIERIKAWGGSPWPNLVGLGIAVLGIVLAWYFYAESVAERMPRYLVDPARTAILDPTRLEHSPIRVLRSDAEGGGEITQPLTSAMLYFWNEGKLSIKRENVLEPLRIRLAGPGGKDRGRSRYIDARIVNQPRAVTGAVLKRDGPERDFRFELAFERLELNDGVAIQILWEGDPKAEFIIEGVIEGPAEIRKAGANLGRNVWKSVRAYVFVVLGIAVFVLFTLLLERGEKNARWSRVSKVASRILGIGCVGIVALFLLGLILMAIDNVRTPDRDAAPESIRTSR